MITKTIFTHVQSWLSAVAFGAALFFTSSHALADTVQITTLTKPGGLVSGVTGNSYTGFVFTTDNSDYKLTSISVSLSLAVVSGGSGTLQGDLYLADHFTLPFGPSLGTFFTSDAIGVSSFVPASFHSNTPITLLANTRYVFALSTAVTATNIWFVEFTWSTNGFDLPAGGQWLFNPGQAYGTNGIWYMDPSTRMRASVSASRLIPDKGGHRGPKPGHCESPLISLDLLDGNYSSGTAINKSGQVVMVGNTFESGWQHTYLYTDGVLKDIGTLGGNYINGMAVNDRGQVTGVGSIADDWKQHPFIYANGVLRDLGLLPGWDTSTVFGINDRGDVLGYFAKSDYSQIAPFLYSNGVMKEIGTLGGHYTFGNALNKSGQVVGTGGLAGDVQYRAFLYSGGVMTDLGTLGGSSASADAINDKGEIAGSSKIAGDAETHPYLYSRGVMKDLGTIPGWTVGSPSKINNRGEVVGTFWNSDYTQSRGFLYSRGVMKDLGLPAGWPITSVSGINDNGDVVGYFISADYSQMHGFLYTDGTLKELDVAFSDLLSDGTAAGFISLGMVAGINEAGVMTGSGQYFDGLNFYSTQAFVLDTKAHCLGKKN